MIQLQQAEGEFVLPQPLPSRLLLVTAGSGITPVIGMLRNLFSRKTPTPTDIVLVHVNVSQDSAIFRDELRAHATSGNLRLVERYDDRDGLLDVNELDDLVPDVDERLAYACGPAGLLDALEEHHADARPDADHRAVPPRPWSRPATAAPSRSRAAPPSTPTAPPRSSTSPKPAAS